MSEGHRGARVVVTSPLCFSSAQRGSTGIHVSRMDSELSCLFSTCLVGVVPILVALRVRLPSLRIMSSLLGLFALTHGLYHLSEAFGVDFLSDVILEPTSVVFLLAFGVYYSKKGIP